MTPSDTELYRTHAPELIRYATVLVGPDDAADVVADAVIGAFTSPRWRHVEQHRAYLFRAVLNAANARHRSRRRREGREQIVAARSIPNDEPSPETRLDVHVALGRLSTQQRAVVYLAYWEDCTPGEIARILAIGEGSVRKQLARARAQLREVIDHV